ncbi:MAG: VTT domain-containing protein [Planctomycetota bacterium]
MTEDPEKNGTGDVDGESSGDVSAGKATPGDGAPGGEAAEAIRRLGVAAWLGMLWFLLPAIGGLTLLFVFIGPASEWLRGHGDAGPYVYVGVFTLTAGIGILPTFAQAFVGGWAFGFVPGTLAALAGFVGASVVGRVIAKTLVRGKVTAEIDRHPKARAVRDALVGRGWLKTLGIVTLVRIPPNSPFSLTNGVLATTGVPLWIYIVGTAVGMLPRTAAVVWLGSEFALRFDEELTRGALKEARPGWWLPVAVGLMVVVFVVLYQIGKRAIDRVTGGGSGASDAAEA